MVRPIATLLLIAGLGCFAFAAEPPPDWSKFASAGEVAGEVTKVGSDGFTIRVTWYAPKNATNTTRPQLGRTGQQYAKPNTTRPAQMTEHHQDYDLTFADGGLVRHSTLPPKLDEKGKKVDYTVKELEDIKKPAGTKGYAAQRTDLKVGQIVDAILVRPKDIPEAKAQTADLRVKTAIILKEVASTTPTTDPKKKN